MTVEETINHLMPQLRAIASRLSMPHADDLVSEMVVAILQLGHGHADALYLSRAKDRARDYMRKERRAVRNESSLHDTTRRPGGRGIPGAEELADIYGMDAELVRTNLGWE